MALLNRSLRGEPFPDAKYWDDVRHADEVLWRAATPRSFPGKKPTIETRGTKWSHDEMRYLYSAARPRRFGAARLGSMTLCNALETEKGHDLFGRQRIQYQLSGELGDKILKATFGTFELPPISSEEARETLIDDMLASDARQGEFSARITDETYFLLRAALQLGISRPE